MALLAGLGFWAALRKELSIAALAFGGIGILLSFTAYGERIAPPPFNLIIFWNGVLISVVAVAMIIVRAVLERRTSTE